MSAWNTQRADEVIEAVRGQELIQPPVEASTLPVADGEPEQKLQLDTGWVGWLTPSLLGRKRFPVWIFTAVRSRYRFVYPAFDETTLRAIEACEAAWASFGGIFHLLIPDNTSAIITTADVPSAEAGPRSPTSQPSVGANRIWPEGRTPSARLGSTSVRKTT